MVKCRSPEGSRYWRRESLRGIAEPMIAGHRIRHVWVGVNKKTLDEVIKGARGQCWLLTDTCFLSNQILATYFLCGVKAALETGMFYIYSTSVTSWTSTGLGALSVPLNFCGGVQACWVPFTATSGETNTTFNRGSRPVFEGKHLQSYKVNWFSEKLIHVV